MPDITVYGAPWCPDCRRSKKFLTEHRVEFDWIDIDEDPAARARVEEIQDGGRSIPTILFPDGEVLIEPSNDELAAKLGLRLEASRASYDIAIAGGGPAGLAAAIYAAREGLETVVIEKSALGGQSGVTDRIENYPGFPDGIAGAELAERFQEQAARFGVELLPAVGVERITPDNRYNSIELSNGQELCAPAVLIATGSSYRRLNVPGEEDLIGSGVHFCATCDGPFYDGATELLVVGGGNSGLEEGIFLSKFAEKVRIIDRNPQLKASQLLQDKVRSRSAFEIHLNTTVVELKGKRKLEEVVARNTVTGEEYRWHPAGAFVFAGLDPNTEFLKGTIELDQWGFIVADNYRTSVPGIFAAGDCRAGSTKQLGAAVGEGITGLLTARQYLRDLHEARTPRVNA
ncbi:MAG: FAD-dependent oxidoreductase [Dehalococcoidia bacterium]